MKDGGDRNKFIYGDGSFNPFKDLKKVILKKNMVTGKQPTLKEKVKESGPKDIKVPEKSDQELFAEAMRDVREIKDFTGMPLKQKKAPPIAKSFLSDEEALQDLEAIASGQRPISLPDTQEYVEWLNNGYRTSLIKKLRRGHFSVRDSLDLHGFTLEEAEKEVDLFMKESLMKGHQCVKIIHGRGLRSPHGPVLKEAVIRWLTGRYRKHMAAFVTARQCDGGLGAIYVLLKMKN